MTPPSAKSRGPASAAVLAGLAAGLAACLAACSANHPPRARSDGAAGQLEVAIGPDLRRFGLADTTCQTDPPGTSSPLTIVGRNADGSTVLTAHLPHDLGPSDHSFGPEKPQWGAAASVLETRYADEPYKLIQVIAHRAYPAHDYRCTASRRGQQVAIKCNAARVFPWFSPTPVPTGSFRASLVCGAPDNPAQR